MKSIMTCSWTTRKENPGGHETGYDYLRNHFKTVITTSPNDKPIIIKDAGCPMDVKCDISFWGNPFDYLAEQFNNSGYKKMSQERLKDKDSIKIANSSFMAEDMERIGLNPDYIIPTGVDLDFFKPSEFGKNKRKRGLFVGDKINVKNWPMIEKVMKKFPEIDWKIITKSMNLNKEQMRDEYQFADFFILTSPVEGCSNAIFEAMACNVPCIVSKTGYFWDFWDKRIGMIVDHDSFIQHVEAIKLISISDNNPRQVILDRKLDINTWIKKWGEVIERFNN